MTAPAATTEESTPDPSQAVAVAYVHSNDVTYSWHHSMVELIGHDLANHGRIIQGGYISIRCGTGGLVEARNQAVAEFLAEGKAHWLLWIDTDMGFRADLADRLIEAADPLQRPIVGALCFSQRELDPDGMGGWRCAPTPTILDWAKVDVFDDKTVRGERRRTKVGEQQGFAVRWDYPANTVVKCAGTGSAAILIHRNVFERISDKFGPVWYDRITNPSTNQLVGEDLSFCMRAGAIDIPVHVHTGVPTTHQKQVWLAEEDYWRMRAFDRPAGETADND